MRQTALIRGINVGRAKRVAMSDLRALAERLGYREVRTLLNSGNLVFTVPRAARSAATAARLEKALVAELGISARVIVLSSAELDAVISENPLLGIADDPSRLVVAVLNNPADRSGLKPLLRETWTPEALGLGARAAYLWCPAGQIESRLFPAVGRVLKDAVTTRNWATILKLQAMVEAE